MAIAYRVALEEQETIINIQRTEGGCSVYTTDTTMMTKLDRLCREAPENYQCFDVGRLQSDHSVVSKEYTITDKGLLSFKAKRREYSAEYRAELAERLRMAKLHE